MGQVDSTDPQRRLVTVTGTGGAGKTRLVHELALRIGAVVRGRRRVGRPDPRDRRRQRRLGSGSELRSVRFTRRARPRPHRRPAPHANRRLVVLDNCEHVLAGAAEVAETVLGTRRSLGAHRDQPRNRSTSPARSCGASRRWQCPPRPMATRTLDAPAPSRCSWNGRRRPTRRSTPPATNSLTSSRSAVGSTASRSPSNSPPPGCGRCRSPTSNVGSTTASTCSPQVPAPSNATAPCTRRSTGATTCSTSRRRSRSDVSPCSPARSRWPTQRSLTTGDPIESTDVFALVASLVDKSLVQRIDDRYGMLETIRAYAVERCAEAGELDACRARHFDHLRRLAEVWAVDEMLPPSATIAAASAHVADLRAALDWGSSLGLEATGVLVAALANSLAVDNRFDESNDLVRRALADIPEGSPHVVRAGGIDDAGAVDRWELVAGRRGEGPRPGHDRASREPAADGAADSDSDRRPHPAAIAFRARTTGADGGRGRCRRRTGGARRGRRGRRRRAHSPWRPVSTSPTTAPTTAT